MENNSEIKGRVSVDRTDDDSGELLLSDGYIVISDEAANVVCLVPFDAEGDEQASYAAQAEEIVARLNATAGAPLPEDVRTLATQVAYDAAGLLQCNCSYDSTQDGPRCDGSCTHSMAERLRERLQAAPAAPTPEAHHDALMREIEHEIRTYGVASLAGLIASSMGVLYDPEDDRRLTPREAHYRRAEEAYAQLSETLARLARPFDLPDTGGAQ